MTEPGKYEILGGVDTPTICNAIEVASGSRAFSGFTKVPMVATHPGAPPMVGRALTAKIRAKSSSPEPRETVARRRMDYYKYISEGEKPAIVVIEDLDAPEITGAFWGEINATVHKAFGLAGGITNGLVRDLGELPEGFPLLGGAVGVSHAFVHIVEFNTPVNVCGLEVRPGDMVHADLHGAVVIPASVLPDMKEAISELMATELLVLEKARNSENYDFETFRASWEAFEGSRT